MWRVFSLAYDYACVYAYALVRTSVKKLLKTFSACRNKRWNKNTNFAPAKQSQHTNTTCRNIVTRVWPPFSNLSQQRHTTCRNTVVKRTQHVAPNNVAIRLRWHVAIVWRGLYESGTCVEFSGLISPLTRMTVAVILWNQSSYCVENLIFGLREIFQLFILHLTNVSLYSKW